jgi:hypothetical protein
VRNRGSGTVPKLVVPYWPRLGMVVRAVRSLRK